MISLEGVEVIGRGATRVCFRHPEVPDKCIKVDIDPKKRVSQKEVRFFKRFKRRGIDWSMLPEYYGRVDTDRGEGYVFRLVRDFDGKSSKTLGECLRNQPDWLDYKRFGEALIGLKAYLRRERVTVYSLLDYNIVYQRVSDKEERLVVVDSIGNNQFLPLSNYIPVMARNMISRKWFQLEKRLLRDFGDNPHVVEAVRKLRVVGDCG